MPMSGRTRQRNRDIQTNEEGTKLLKEVSRLSVPIILKRGMSATIKERLMTAEYIVAD